MASDSAQFLSLNLFIPSLGKGAKVYVNNHLQGVAAENSFFNLNREWRNCDCIRVQFDFKFRVESMPDDKNTVAIFTVPYYCLFKVRRKYHCMEKRMIYCQIWRLVTEKVYCLY